MNSRAGCIVASLAILSSCSGGGGGESLPLVGGGRPTEQSASPVAVFPEMTFTAIGSGYAHNCAIDLDGRAWCWGLDEYGELGSHAMMSRCVEDQYHCSARPLLVETDQRFVAIDGTRGHGRTCALTAGGQAWCWGQGEFGQMGNGTRAVRNDPGPVAGNISFSVLRLSQAGSLTCGIGKDGTSYCWGGIPMGIHPPPSDSYLVPTPMPWTPRFVTLDIGQNHMCGLTAEGEAWCWGSNWYGQIGIGTNDAPGAIEAKVPTRVMGGHAFRMIATSSDTTCAMEADGSTWCWGLATGGPGASNLPVRVSLAPAFVSIHATLLEMCGLTATGEVWCWAGAGVSPSVRPQRLSTDTRFARLASHPQCGLDPAGKAWCWGNNDFHQLGY